MKKHTILVTGASGNVGKALVEMLRNTQNRVIASYHNNAPDNMEKRVEYRHFDITNSSTFDKATEGVDKVFLIRPPHIAKIKRDVLPFLLRLKAIGISHVVFLSVQGVQEQEFIPHAKIEHYLQTLNIPHTSIRPCYFMQNFTTTHLTSLQKGSLILPCGSGKTSFVDVKDVASIAAIILEDDSYIYQHITITSKDSFSFTQAIEKINRTCNLSIQFKLISPFSFFFNQINEKRSLIFIIVMIAIYSNISSGKANIISTDASAILPEEFITIEQFSKEHCSLLKGE